MSTINFLLNRGLQITDKSKAQPIYVRYRNGRKCDLTRSLRIAIEPKYWNAGKEEVKAVKQVKNAVAINNRLKEVRRHFEEYDKYCIEKGIKPTTADALKHYKNFTNPREESNFNLLSFFKYYIDNSDNKETTKKAHLTSLRLFQRFNNEVRPIDFEDMNLEFYDDFMAFCKDNEFSVNYRGKLIKTLKTVLNEAVKRKHHSDTQFRYFKVERKDVFNVYLNEDELTRLYKLDLSNEDLLQRVRDLFLLGAWTSLRVSDFNYLSEQNIIEENGRKFINVKTEKTGKRVVIPVHPIVDDILRRHGNKPPRRVKDQTINKKLKLLCKRAGIDDTIEIKLKGGKKEKVFKYDLVKTHTARRSFATNAYLSGLFDTFDIMTITGHTTQQNFLNYIKADELEKARKLANNPFFNPTGNLRKVN